ncbi:MULTISPECIES: hypothetical protein [unclassified Duganella]|uniref:hypothetical protein n=1 Tax=unclassified Duganella TaxID=2636909 RepID=UPI0011C1AD40|nr:MULTISPECIES: hypothetical protein [unclassified Duganella]
MSVGYKIEQAPDGQWIWRIINLNPDGTQRKTITSQNAFATQKEAEEDIERYCVNSSQSKPDLG